MLATQQWVTLPKPRLSMRMQEDVSDIRIKLGNLWTLERKDLVVKYISLLMKDYHAVYVGTLS
jgi:hypothetical protein